MERMNPPTVFTPPGTYEHVVVVPCKKLVFLSGQVPVDKDGNVVGIGPKRRIDLEAQLRQTYANIKECLNAAGADFKDVVRMTTYVVGSALNEYRDINLRKVKAEVMGGQYGTGTVVAVYGLVRPEVLVEIETIAVLQE